MFTIERPETNLVTIRTKGKLDSDAMKEAIDKLYEETEGIRYGKMCYDLLDVNLPTLGAIAEEITRIPQLLEIAKRFDRVAILADSEWVRQASELQGNIIPDLEVKAFDREKDVEAIAWLKTSPSKR